MSGHEDNAEYLGDGVYASFDGYHVSLDTRAQNPVNYIALGPSVLAALARYVARLNEPEPEPAPQYETVSRGPFEPSELVPVRVQDDE